MDSVPRSRATRFVAIAALLGTIAITVSATGAPAVTTPVVSLPTPVLNKLEGNSGASNATLTVSLSPSSTNTVTVAYATVDGTAKTSDSDYVSTSGTLTFAPGVTTQPISVPVNGDTTAEDYQTFLVKLSSPTNANLGHPSETVQILNDDKPALSLPAAKASEGQPAIFKPHLVQRYYQDITLNAQTSDSTATAPGDYTALTGTVMFPADSKIAVSVPVSTIDDSVPEVAETFKLALTGSGVIAGLTGTATILASDGTLPVVSLPAVVLNKVEGNSGSSVATLTVSLNQSPVTTVTVNYATADGSAKVSGGDYAATSGTLSFAPGVTTRPISVSVNGDSLLEDYQTFLVKLSAPTNATLGTASQTVQILNDDTTKLAMSAVSVSEGQPAVFNPHLVYRYYQDIVLNAQTSDITAHAPSDYASISHTVTFPAGTKTTVAVPVSTVGDSVPELTEAFYLALSGSGVLNPLTVKATILANAGSICVGATAPATYSHVVVVVGENRTWNSVGAGFSTMPFLRGLATGCAYYPTWNETNPNQNSLTQYIGLTSGVDNPATVDDCDPSASCRSTDNNIFRQVRAAGGTPRSFVEGATTGCSASGNAAKHIPALYYFGGSPSDDSFCSAEVRPLTELDVNALPTFAFVSPDLCNDGHDCPNSTVDGWMNDFLTPILASADYQAGNTAVIVVYDEDRPVPNLLMSKSAHAGPISGTGSHANLLLTIEQMLGLPTMPQGQLPSATSLRSGSGL